MRNNDLGCKVESRMIQADSGNKSSGSVQEEGTRDNTELSQGIQYATRDQLTTSKSKA